MKIFSFIKQNVPFSCLLGTFFDSSENNNNNKTAKLATSLNSAHFSLCHPHPPTHVLRPHCPGNEECPVPLSAAAALMLGQNVTLLIPTLYIL